MSTLAIAVGRSFDDSGAKSTSTARYVPATVRPYFSYGIDHYEVSGSGPDGERFGPLTVEHANSTTRIGVSHGEWTITATGVDDRGNILVRGEETIAVSAPEVRLTVNVEFLQQATGNIAIILSWPSWVEIDRVRAKLNGSQPELIPVDGTIVTYAKTGVRSGFHELALELMHGDGLKATVFEIVHVYDHLTATTTIALTEDELKTPLVPRDVTATLTADRSVRITWDASHVRTETGFMIERDTEREFATPTLMATVGPNVELHEDDSAETGRTYYYRVASVNTYGRSEWTALAAVLVGSENGIGTLRWSFTTKGAITASPAIAADGAIYVGSQDGNLYAINPDGSLRWSFRAGLPIAHAAALDNGGTIYAAASSPETGTVLFALHPDGSLKWRASAYDESVRASPSIGADGTIYVQTNGTLYAIDTDGAELWSSSPHLSKSKPTIGADGSIYLTKYSDFYEGIERLETLYQLHANGSYGWRSTLGVVIPHGYITVGGEFGDGTSPAVGPDGTIYVGTPSTTLVAVNPDGSQQWDVRLSRPRSELAFWGLKGIALGADGTIYASEYPYGLHAINADGSRRWFFDRQILLDRGLFLNPSATPSVGADGTIYVNSSSGLVAISEDGSFRWQYPYGGLLQNFYDSISLTDSSPAISRDGTIYVGSQDGKLYALRSDSPGLGDVAGSAWPTLGRDVRRAGRSDQADRYLLELAMIDRHTFGTVTSTPAGIDCGASGSECSAFFPAGTAVTLTATASAGYRFAAWSGSCSGSRPTCTVEMASPRSVSAEFEEPTGLNLSIAAVHLNQAIQTLDGSVPLVAGRDALLRVFVLANESNTARPRVRVRLYRDGTPIGTHVIGSEQASVPTALSASPRTATWNLRLPGASVAPGLSVLAEVDPDDEVREAIEQDNTFPYSGVPHPLDVRRVPDFLGRLVPVHRSAYGTTGDVNQSNKSEYLGKFLLVYPIDRYDVSVRATYTTTAENAFEMLREIEQLRIADGSDRYYYGVFQFRSGDGAYGKAGYRTAIGGGSLDAELYAHEVGHTFSLGHAPCGTSGFGFDRRYPYPSGNIGHWGWNPADGSFIDPSVSDLMGYCNPSWISDYHYNNVLEYRDRVARDGRAGAQPVLVIWGSVSEAGITISPAYVDPRGTATEPEPGPYSLEGLDESGSVLFSRSFHGWPVSDGERGLRHFSFGIPVAEAGVDRLAALRVRGEGHEEVLRSTSRTRLDRTAATSEDATEPVRIEGVDRKRVRVRWDGNRFPLAVIRDARSGDVLSFARGGDVIVFSDSRELEVQLSDGVRSSTRTLAVVGR